MSEAIVWMSTGQGPFSKEADPEIINWRFTSCEPTPVGPEAKPGFEYLRLNSLEDAMNFQTRYAERIAVVLGWLTEALVSSDYEIDVAMLDGPPSQAFTWFANTLVVYGVNEGGKRCALRIDLVAALRSPTVAYDDLVRAGFVSQEHSGWVEPAEPTIVPPTPVPAEGLAKFGALLDRGAYEGCRSVAADNTVPPGTHAVVDGVEYVYHVVKAGIGGKLKLWIPVEGL